MINSFKTLAVAAVITTATMAGAASANNRSGSDFYTQGGGGTGYSSTTIVDSYKMHKMHKMMGMGKMMGKCNTAVNPHGCKPIGTSVQTPNNRGLGTRPQGKTMKPSANSAAQ